MGPIVILDKSAFQSLSKQEHLLLHAHFKENLTPILALELLADLRKESPGSTTAAQKVAVLANKFGGSGPATNIDYQTLCVQSLLGNHFPLDGRIIPQSGYPVHSRDGTRGFFVTLSLFNHAILRWARGQFEEFEREFAGFWREAARNLELESFRDWLNKHHVILPKVDSMAELMATVDALLATSTLQDVWLSWLLDQLSVPVEYEVAIRVRWRSRSSIFLQNFSPYSWHCLRVLLALLLVSRHKLLKWQPTNLLDIQYLYYLPFCMVFVSDDYLHCALAPLLRRDDQSFVMGKDLKADLRRIADFRESLFDKDQQKLGYALGDYPPPRKDSTVHALWKKHCLPWHPGRGNLVTSLPDEVCREALCWVEQMFRDVEGDTYFEGHPITS